MEALDVVAMGICGALYASLGYLTHLGLFTPVIGVVRFWPAVVVPAVFAVLFGKHVGGVGAAIGIFLSDLLIHGDALLSLTVGVPSNFLGFYILGAVSRQTVTRRTLLISLSASVSIMVSAILLYTLDPMYFGAETSLLFIGISVICVALTVGIYAIAPRWRSVSLASVIGLGVGALWIGVGAWAYSQAFILSTGETQLSGVAALGWFLWTYVTEIPFLLLAVPPIVQASAAVVGHRFPLSVTVQRTSDRRHET